MFDDTCKVLKKIGFCQKWEKQQMVKSEVCSINFHSVHSGDNPRWWNYLLNVTGLHLLKQVCFVCNLFDVIHLCEFVYMTTVPLDVRTGHKIPQSWSCRQLGVLGSQMGSSAIAMPVLNCWAIYPASEYILRGEKFSFISGQLFKPAGSDTHYSSPT